MSEGVPTPSVPQHPVTPSWGAAAPGSHPFAPAPTQPPGFIGHAMYRPPEYASWGARLGALLLDLLIDQGIPVAVGAVGLTLAQLGSPDHLGPNKHNNALQIPGFILLGIGFLALFLLPLWNVWYREGVKGSYGKSLMGIQVVRELDGQPIGVGLAVARDILRLLNTVPLCLGYLWPLWDARNQTFSDKVLRTVVVRRQPAPSHGSGHPYY